MGPGVSEMDTDYRNGIDVMTTETTCLSSVWRTDEDTRKFLKLHGREDDYKELNPGAVTYYDGMVYVNLCGSEYGKADDRASIPSEQYI